MLPANMAQAVLARLLPSNYKHGEAYNHFSRIDDMVRSHKQDVHDKKVSEIVPSLPMMVAVASAPSVVPDADEASAPSVVPDAAVASAPSVVL